MFRFDDLILEKVIFEVRFHNGYLYWDNCGKIWRAITDTWPNLVARNVTPERAHFQLSEEGIDISFSHNRMGTDQDHPKKLDIYKKFTKDSFHIILEGIQVNTFSRVGNRYQYTLRFDDDNEVVKFFTSYGFLDIHEKINNIGKNIKEPSVRFIIEKDDISITINISFFRRNIELTIPKPIKVDTSEFIKQGILFDIDFFSTKRVERGIFDVEEFINTHERNCRRVIETLFK